MICASLFAQKSTSANGTDNATPHETHVTPAQALNVGYAFMRTGDGSKGNGTKSGTVSKQAMQLVYTGQATDNLTGTVTNCYYVFALQPKGFVIVAADDRVEPILGYSYDNDFVVEDMPDHVRGWLGNYERQIEALANSDLQPTPATQTKWTRLKNGQAMSTKSGTTVGPLLTTTWDQGQYYNSLCPTDASGPTGHVYTGCVATAMAQIINYWGYPAHGRGTHRHSGYYGMLTVNYDNANYNYTLMPNELTDTSTLEEVNAVATLMRDCGVAVNMEYGPTESSSYDVDARAAFINFYRFSPNLSFAEKAYFTDSEWNAMLHEDLNNNRPVYYSGQGSGGHSFVCDGYDADGYYHFNFGWGGFADGWFLTSSLTPGGSNFNSDQTAIFGIVPDSTGNVILGQMAGTSTFVVDEPLEFYHTMGHNAYTGGSYNNLCNNTVNFVSANNNNQLVADIVEYEDQRVTLYDGDNTWLRSLNGGVDNDLSPVVSSNNALKVSYVGNLYYAGFKLNISQDNGCRMVSNITPAIEATTVHLTWTENGSATQWQIEYGVKGFDLGNGILYSTSTNTATFSNLQPFTEYDFYIRPVCGDGQYGPWKKETLLVEALYWQDIVTSQPTGYVYDTVNDRVEVSSAEGLAWWARTNNQKSVLLTADIDLSGYKWRPVEGYHFNGNGHVISNAHIIENNSWAGFFSHLLGDCKDLGFVDFYVKSTGSNTGGLCGQFGLSGQYHGTLTNCYVSNGVVIGTDYVGGMVGFAQECSIINCYSNVSVLGNRWSGLMVGNAEHQIIKNCYSAGNVTLLSYCYFAGIAAYISTGNVDHCYSVELPMGVIGYKGSTDINDTSTFHKENGVWALNNPVRFDDEVETELLSALNKGVEMMNDGNLKVWAIDSSDSNNGYPVFGNYYNVTCSNIDSLSVTNIMVNSTPCVLVEWAGTNDATQYQIRYLKKDAPYDSAVTTVTNSNPDTLYGIPLGDIYDISVRALCDSNDRSAWITTRVIVDLPYWTDMVTSQPSGYVEDANGNVEISSAEGLAWLSVLCNGLNGQPARTFAGKQITLTADISLAGYRWWPIGDHKYPTWHSFSGSFDGNNHNIYDIYIRDSKSFFGLFGLIYCLNYSHIKNVNMVGGSISSIMGSTDYEGFRTNQACLGGLAGMTDHVTEISNCHSSVNVVGLGAVGSLVGRVMIQSGTMDVANCSATGDVSGRESCGGLIGEVYGPVTVKNCYATGDVYLTPGDNNARYRGGLLGNFMSNASVYNCYSTGYVDPNDSQNDGKVIGCPYSNTHIHYMYGKSDSNPGLELIGNYCEDISDTAQFLHDGNSNALTMPITIDSVNHTDLLDALNAWVDYTNDSALKTWILDGNSGYPVLGDYYAPTCINPSGLTVSNATTIGDSTIRTRLSWNQIGEPDHWEVLYVAAEHSKDEGVIVTVDSNPCILTGIPVGNHLDFYVRAFCDSTDHSGWSTPVTYIPDKLHWTEVVTSQPAGYVEDANGNVLISDAEGLAWLASVANGLNGAWNNLNDKKVFLKNDVDMSAYRWTPIETEYLYFDGKSHTISGLYCNDMRIRVGFVGVILSGEIKNVNISDCSVRGTLYAGGLVGFSNHTKVSNCNVSGTVSSIMLTGGLIGSSFYSSIVNSCFIGNIEARNDVTYEDATKGSLGGLLAGSYQDTIINNYVACEVPEEVYSSIIVGSNTNSVISNNYCMYYPTNLPFTSTGNTTNLSFFTGSGHTWTLTTPPYISGAFYTDLVEALNAWVDANNPDDAYLNWLEDTAMVNGGFPLLETILCPDAYAHDTIVVCDSYTWHDAVFTTDTLLTDTLSTIAGCDSIVTHHLTVNHSVTELFEATACDSYVWNDSVYTQSGEYTQMFSAANGCDSVVTLHLTVNYSNTGDTTAIVCDSFDWYEQTNLTQSGDYTRTITNSSGCDSVVTLHLTVNYSNTGDTTAVACDSFDWYEQTSLTQSGDYTRTISNASGCDSVVTLHLTISPADSADFAETACESFTWEGTTYTTSGDYTQTFTNIAGCDSVVTLHLTVNYSNTGDTTAIACDSFDWYEQTNLTQSGDYTRTISNASGCDSVVTLHLTISPADSADFAETACESFTWEGTTYTTSGDYTQTFTNIAGCDSMVTLHLTVNYSSTGDTTAVACDSFDWYEQTNLTQSGDYTRTVTNASGCDSVVTLHLTVNYSNTGDTTAVVCDSFDWYEQTNLTQSGDYTRTVTNASGCDSVVTLHLTVNYSVAELVEATTCDSYTWNDSVYTQSGDYTQTFTSANGCDSVVTLHLTVNYATHNVETETACDSYTWHDVTYTTSGTYTYEYTNTNGCASVDTLHLTVNYATSSEFAVETSDSCYTWNSETYCTSGDYTQTLQTIDGCDSLVTLHLTVSVGIDDHDGFDFNLYPNPTSGIVNIQCTNHNSPITQIHVFDAYGKLVDVVETNAHGSSAQTAQIDLSGFASGIYFVKAVADGNVVAVRKIVKR